MMLDWKRTRRRCRVRLRGGRTRTITVSAMHLRIAQRAALLDHLGGTYDARTTHGL